MPGIPLFWQWKQGHLKLQVILSCTMNPRVAQVTADPVSKGTAHPRKKFLASWSMTLLSLPNRDGQQDCLLACWLYCQGDCLWASTFLIKFRFVKHNYKEVSNVVSKGHSRLGRANHRPVLMTWGKEQDVTFQQLPGIRSCFSEDQGKLGYIPYSSFGTSTHRHGQDTLTVVMYGRGVVRFFSRSKAENRLLKLRLHFYFVYYCWKFWFFFF